MVKLLYKFKDFKVYILRVLLLVMSLLILWKVCEYCNEEYFKVPTKIIYDIGKRFNTPKSNITRKYILNWNKHYLLTSKYTEILYSKLRCKFSNCIITDNRNLLGDYRRFDAIVFSEGDLDKPREKLQRPKSRNISQLYIFLTIESPCNKPACETYSDEFYNWTFTYRLDSDILWNYFIILNTTGHVVAPNTEVDWQVNKDPVNPRIKSILQHKTKAAAWLVSNCKAPNLRNDYVNRLKETLFHFSLEVDVYGKCSNRKCTNDNCDGMLLKDYYFYIAFENSFSDDYVTEKVLHGYNNYAVPIVYGAANYNRFLPPGSYVNALDYHPYNLAFLIKEAMTDPSKYEEYFRWTNSYTITEKTLEHNPICNLCEALNSDKVKHARVYKKFRLWWNGLHGMKWCLGREHEYY